MEKKQCIHTIPLILNRRSKNNKNNNEKINLLWLYHYRKDLPSNSLKIETFIVASTGKSAYNENGTMMHLNFHLLLSLSNILPLSYNTLDIVTKYYEQIRLLLIDEASLISSQMLHCIDNSLCEIMHRKTFPSFSFEEV